MPAMRGRRARQIDIWPGFVDALATLIMVIVFVLLIFTLFQFYLKDILAGRDQALQWLNQQLGEIADMLAVERQATSDLKGELARLQDELAASLGQREALASKLAASDLERAKLATQLSEAGSERDRLQALVAMTAAERDRLKNDIAAANDQLKDKEAMSARLATELTDANKTIDADKEKIEVQLRDLANLRREVETLVILRRELEAKLAEQAKQLNESGAALGEQKRLSEDAKLRIDLLTRQLNALRDQLAQLNAALEASEAKSSQQQVQIADLGRRLNLALASKVEELARYRSEFFGRVRQALGNRADIRVVGDRFVFQSELLFASGSAELEPAGLDQLGRLAAELVDIAKKIPPDLNWVLQVDGHTDSRPINNLIYPSNWELSAARAISVAKFLISRGIPAGRVSAAGFAEFQPLDQGEDEIAYRRNRRIELKLTTR